MNTQEIKKEEWFVADIHARYGGKISHEDRLSIIERCREVERRAVRDTYLKAAEEILALAPIDKKFTGFGVWSKKGMHIDDHKRFWCKEMANHLTSLGISSDKKE